MISITFQLIKKHYTSLPTDSKRAGVKKQSAKGAKPDLSHPVSIESEEEKRFEENVIKIIENLQSNRNQAHTHEFSCDLNARERRMVHEIAEKYQIHHFSIGEEQDRYIVLSTRPSEQYKVKATTEKQEAVVAVVASEADVDIELIIGDQEDCVTSKGGFAVLDQLNNENELKAESEKKKNSNKRKTPAVSNPTPLLKAKVSGHLLGEIEDQDDSQTKFRADVSECPHCQKYILKLSFMMHEMHCAKVNKGAETKPTSVEALKPKGFF